MDVASKSKDENYVVLFMTLGPMLCVVLTKLVFSGCSVLMCLSSWDREAKVWPQLQVM